MAELIGHSITCRVAVGPRAGQKVFALQTVPASEEGERSAGAAQHAGFSLHAGTLRASTKTTMLVSMLETTPARSECG
jgi:hypothetical protein